jgi:hypothetical protein
MPLDTLQPDSDQKVRNPGDRHWDDEFNNLKSSKELQDLEKSVDDRYADQAAAVDAKNDLGEAVRDGEQTGGTWANNTTKRESSGGVGGMKGLLQKGKVLLKNKGATAAIIALLGGGAFIPFLGAGGLQFSIVGNMNSTSALLGLSQYNQDFLGFKLFGPNKASVQNGAKGKVAGLTSGEVAQLKENGVTFQGEKKNPLTKKTTFTAVRYQDGPWINAGKDFTTELKKNPAFRKAMVYTKVSTLSSLWKANKSAAAQAVKSKFRINTNPDISGDDKSERDKKMYSNAMEGTDSSLGSSTRNLDEENTKNPNEGIRDVA